MYLFITLNQKIYDELLSAEPIQPKEPTLLNLPGFQDNFS
jgi:hypothetical protein